MTDKPSDGAKPVQRVATRANLPASEMTIRERYALDLGAAIMIRQNGRTPTALAREVTAFTDAFLDALAAQVN